MSCEVVIVRFFGWFRPKTEVRHNFSNDDRELSLEIREKKKEIALLKLDRENELHKLRIERERLQLKEDIDELKESYDNFDDLSSDNEDDSTTALIKLLAPLFLQNKVSSSVVPSDSITSPPVQKEQPKQDLTDEQLLSIWKETPKIARKFAQSLSDENLRIQIEKQLPMVSNQTIARAIDIIRNH